jgi:hypothetical protein
MGSDGFEKVLIGRLGPRETFLGVAKRRAVPRTVNVFRCPVKHVRRRLVVQPTARRLDTLYGGAALHTCLPRTFETVVQ